jgi:hypothetical protein
MTEIMNGKSGSDTGMPVDESKERMKGFRDRPLEERISIISATLHETIRDLAAVSRDLLCSEEGHALIRKSVEDAGKKLESIRLEKIRHRYDGKERIGEDPEDFKRREIHID